jgi:hypothetical protein
MESPDARALESHFRVVRGFRERLKSDCGKTVA